MPKLSPKKTRRHHLSSGTVPVQYAALLARCGVPGQGLQGRQTPACFLPRIPVSTSEVPVGDSLAPCAWPTACCCPVDGGGGDTPSHKLILVLGRKHLGHTVETWNAAVPRCTAADINGADDCASGSRRELPMTAIPAARVVCGCIALCVCCVASHEFQQRGGRPCTDVVAALQGGELPDERSRCSSTSSTRPGTFRLLHIANDSLPAGSRGAMIQQTRTLSPVKPGSSGCSQRAWPVGLACQGRETKRLARRS